MVNREVKKSYGRALVAADMSEPSAHALHAASALGLTGHASVTIVHAFTALGRGKLSVANVPRERIDEYVTGERLQSREELAAFLAAHEIHDQRWTYRIEEGGAFEVICRIAKETMPDLVVIGTHGRSGIAKMLLGSVAEEVLRSNDVDILAVPPIR